MGRNRSQRRKLAKRSVSRKNTDSSPQGTGTNLSFSGSLKIMNKFLKAVHHAGYLNSLKPGQFPPAIEDERKKLARFWKPSSITQTFSDEVQTFGDQYFDSIIKSLIRHHLSTVDILKVELQNKCSLNSVDFDAAQKKAIVWAKKNLGKRLKDCSISKFNVCMAEVKSSLSNSDDLSSHEPSLNPISAENDQTGAPSHTAGARSDPPLNHSSAQNDQTGASSHTAGARSDLPFTPVTNNKKRGRQSSPTHSETGSPQAIRQRVDPMGNDDETDNNTQIEQNQGTLLNTGSSESDKQTSSKSPQQTNSRLYSRVTAVPPVPPASTTPKRPRQVDPGSPGSPGSTNPTNKHSRINSPPTQSRINSPPTQSRINSPPTQRKRPTSITPWNAREEGPDNSWVLPEFKSSIVSLGDSNNSRITKCTARNVQIISFPGGNFCNVSGFLSNQLKGKTYHCVKELILNFGINERQTKIVTMKKRLSGFISLVQTLFPSAKIFMADLQWSPLLPESETSALSHISVELKRLEEQKKIHKIIHRLADDKFVIDKKDRTNIHWSTQCANNMLEHWLDSLN